ncbi:MAG TPA: hypothetical protein VF773_12935 [Verrucomicrobiae bacterium]
MAMVFPAMAHAPYEVEIGSFKRHDGSNISAVVHYVDGIFGRDRAAVKLRLADGTLIAESDRTTEEVVVRTNVNGFIAYRYESDAVPVATSVVKFHGDKLLVVGPTRRDAWVSPFIHTREYLGVYLTMLLILGALFVFWRLSTKIPRRGVMLAVRASLVTLIALGFLVLMFVIFASPISPLIFSLLAVVCFGAYQAALRCCFRREFNV